MGGRSATKANDLAQSISTYTAGCLRGAEALPVTGNGYQMMQLSRVRFYGHPDLLGFFEKMGNAATQQHWGGVLDWGSWFSHAKNVF